MKNYDETSLSSSVSLTDLKREISKFKDTENHSSKYIADLEARLARSDESIVALQQTVEKLEKECERRRDEAEVLQSRLDGLRQDGDSWRSDLEERERKVKELEEQLQIWEKKKQDAGDARVRLGDVVSEVASARRSLQADFVDVAASASNSDESTAATPIDARASTVPYDIAATDASAIVSPAAQVDKALEKQFVALQQTHTATLADLSSVTSKYRDALREISDLAAQIQEAKLSNQEPATADPSTERPSESPSIRRRMTSGKLRETSEQQYNNAGRRLFFRQAASTESLHSR